MPELVWVKIVNLYRDASLWGGIPRLCAPLLRLLPPSLCRPILKESSYRAERVRKGQELEGEAELFVSSTKQSCSSR